MSFLDLCERYFNSRDLYEVLHLQRNASEKEVRKAYHKVSLECHPDRVDESKKSEATEKFKILGKVHSILSNSEKRAIYDDTDVCNWQEDELDNDSIDWMAYWRNLFRKVELSDIEKYELKYKGSDEELSDLKKAFIQWKGDMDKIHQCVPFMSMEDESRIRARIQGLIDCKQLIPYDIFINEPQASRDRRIRKMEREKKGAAKVFKNRKEENGHGTDDLAKAILERRQQTSESFVSALEKKYADPNKKKKGGRKEK